jgi:hypothetical protein
MRAIMSDPPHLEPILPLLIPAGRVMTSLRSILLPLSPGGLGYLR